MFLKLFKRNTPFDYPVLLIYTFITHGVLYFRSGFQPVHESSAFYTLIDFRLLNLVSLNIIVTLTIFLVFFISLMFNRLVINYGFFEVQSFLPAYIFVTLSAIFPDSALISPSFICFSTLLWITFELFKLFDLEQAVQKLFFIGFFIGILSFLFSPLGYYVAFILFAIPALKTPKIREILITLIGYVTPFYLAGLYFWGTGQLNYYIHVLISGFYLPQLVISFNPDARLISVVFLLFLIIISYLNFKWQSKSILVRYVRYYNVLFLYFLMTLIIEIFTPVNKYLFGYFFILPVSMYLSNFFYTDKKNRLKEIMFIILLLTIVLSQLYFLKQA